MSATSWQLRVSEVPESLRPLERTLSPCSLEKCFLAIPSFKVQNGWVVYLRYEHLIAELRGYGLMQDSRHGCRATALCLLQF